MVKDARPIAQVGLAEEAHAGIPAGAVALDGPAPVGDVGQGEPDGDAEGAGEVADAGIGTDHEVEVLHDGSRIHEGAAGAVEVVAEGHDFEIGEAVELIVAVAFLQADEREAVELADGGEAGRWESCVCDRPSWICCLAR